MLLLGRIPSSSDRPEIRVISNFLGKEMRVVTLFTYKFKRLGCLTPMNELNAKNTFELGKFKRKQRLQNRKKKALTEMPEPQTLSTLEAA